MFFARYKLKKHQLQKSQKRSDQMETLLQQMDEALWNEQENVPVGPEFQKNQIDIENAW